MPRRMLGDSFYSVLPPKRYASITRPLMNLLRLAGSLLRPSSFGRGGHECCWPGQQSPVANLSKRGSLKNMNNYYCKHCGTKHSSIQSLTSGSCSRHPLGPNKGKHALYEGSEKSKYQCKFCGTPYSSLSSLTAASCSKHPSGANKGKHEAAL